MDAKGARALKERIAFAQAADWCRRLFEKRGFRVHVQTTERRITLTQTQERDRERPS